MDDQPARLPVELDPAPKLVRGGRVGQFAAEALGRRRRDPRAAHLFLPDQVQVLAGDGPGDAFGMKLISLNDFRKLQLLNES